MSSKLLSQLEGIPAFDLRGRRLFDLRALPIYALLPVPAAVIIWAITAGVFTYDAPLFANTLSAIAIFLLIAWCARWLGFEMIAAPLEMWMLFLLGTFLFAFCSTIVAASNAPMVDEILRKADALFFGFDRQAVVKHALAVPWLMKPTLWIYASLAVTPQLLVALLILTRQYDRAWLILTAMTIAIAVSVLVLLIAPAYGTPPYAYRFIEVLDGLRNGTMRRLDTSIMTGLVTFPSLHAADAVILARGYGWLGKLLLPLVILNILMVGSALIIGGHYLVDLIAGVALAYFAMAVASRLQRWALNLRDPGALNLRSAAAA
jgi:membrane-associated phospholipid phosphatase